MVKLGLVNVGYEDEPGQTDSGKYMSIHKIEISGVTSQPDDFSLYLRRAFTLKHQLARFDAVVFTHGGDTG